MEFEYGQWCTVSGKRYMIVGWTRNTVEVYVEGGNQRFAREVVAEVSDFKETDAERRAKGYAF